MLQMLQPAEMPLCTAPVADALQQIFPEIIKRCVDHLQKQDAAEAWTLLTDALRTVLQQSGGHQVQFQLSPNCHEYLAPGSMYHTGGTLEVIEGVT